MLKEKDRKLLHSIKLAFAKYELSERFYDIVPEVEFKKCDPKDQSNHEYQVLYQNKFLAYIEYYRPSKKFILEFSENWAHITSDNLVQIFKFMKQKEKEIKCVNH